MKHLPNAELRILYLRRQFLTEFIQTTAIQHQANLYDSWERSRDRINAIRDEVKKIVQDPQFDVLVQPATTSHPGAHTYSPAGTMINVLTTARELRSYIDGILGLCLTPKSKQLQQDPKKTAKVFIGHGRNEIVRNKVEDFVRDRCGLQPLVLQDLPSSGLTVIEKLEKYGRTADYAVLILTGDDVMQEEEARRARQNVIQELGWFQGVLGRKRTAILRQQGVEIASNIAGVVYLEFVENNVEMAFDRLRQEFEEAGLLEASQGRSARRGPTSAST